MADEHLISLQPGTVIAGRYEVVKCLGAGSMGLVYACRHRELSGHMVAVKVLFPEVAQDKIAAARFRNEIFASYGVSHPNVVRAYEYLRDGDLVAYTMEYVGGGDLADRLGRTGEPMSVAEVVRLLGQMCAGVQAIHDAGIIHRDLKPENILLTKEGNVKIADFGIARTGHGPKLTEHGGVVGTIDYVSPEYMLNSQVDWRSDIYAIGILGYEMMTGESPFRGDSVYATMTKRLKSDAAPPSSHRADCPKELDAIILRAMHRNPEERYQSAVDMYNDLRAIAQNIPGYSSGSQTIPSMSKSALKIDPVVVEGGASAGGLQTNAVSKQSPAFSRSGPTIPAAEKNGVAHAIAAGDEEPSLAERYSGRYSVKSKPLAPESVGDAAESTQVLNPEISRIASQFDEDQTINEPIRMERVLAYNDLVSEGNWSSGGASGEVNPSAGRINEERLQRLSQQTIYKGRSLWIDMCTVVAAIVIGVGIGYLVLRVFFPDLVRRSHNNAPAVIIQER